MKLFIVPPHADFTLRWEAPEGFEVLDLARAFAERVVGGEAISQALAALRDAKDPEAPRRQVSLEAARALLSRPRGERTHLRALGAALAGLSVPGGGVRLRLDDLELEHGTTERSADALEASQRSPPYAPELERAAQLAAGAAVVRIWLERDQQLPAALALAARVPGDRLEIAGPFARVHRDALRPLFPHARWTAEGARARLAGAPGLPASEWSWSEPDASGWAGPVQPTALLDAKALVASGARAVVIAFCAWDEDLLTVHGERLARRAFERACEAVRREGIRIFGEWWVGGPGVGAALNARTLEALRAGLLDGVVGVRPFHWTRGRTGSRFGDLEVKLGAAPADRDLWRSHPFEAPDTLSQPSLAAALEALPRALLEAGVALAPGRLAQASVSAPEAQPAGGRIGLDPDCAVVSAPVGLDGRPGPVSYAVNLRTGTTLAVDPRLAPAVRALETPASAEGALASLGGQREKVVRALLAKGVLAEVA